ncbi:Tim44 domain-containing protein [Phenylobacterium sp.]|uniref:Tim44 domain-containing protein n=1 Tax=Phenylobacterium sp. TaxID=1871053 RepID=UPI0035695A05
MTKLWSRVGATLGVALALSMLVAAPADARRGGSFGSRGARTYSAPRSTATAPHAAPPVQRSMTAPGAAQPGGAYAPQPGMPGYSAYRPQSRFGGFGGGFLGGLVAGGLISGLMGHGWGGGWGGGGYGGGGGGLFTILIQLAVLFFVISLVTRWFARRRASASMPWEAPQMAYGGPQGFAGGGGGGFAPGPAPAGPYVPPTGPAWEIPIMPQDQKDFERLLLEVQDAFGREDYAALRERCTPEIMGYLAEELSDNATHGRKNEVSGTRLLQADVGEAWSEGPVDYATAAMRYEGIDVTRDRTSGAVLSGDPNRPSETTELWTFSRRTGEPWKLSAIQET